jgi:regulator of nucleoside diphosphate kinase
LRRWRHIEGIAMSTLDQIVLTQNDYARLKRLYAELSGAAQAPASMLNGLEEVLDFARIVRPDEIPSNVVTMNSRVLFEDVRSHAREAVTLVYPSTTDASSRRISVLSPVGMALLGESEGSEVELPVPHGTRRIRILDVLYQPEAEGDFEL